MKSRSYVSAILILFVLHAGCGGGAASVPTPPAEPVLGAPLKKALWNATAGDSAACYTAHVSAWADCSSISVGALGGTATFGRGDAAETTLVATSASDGFFARYDSEGALVWAKLLPGIGWTAVESVATAEDGTFVLCGYLSGDAVLDAGGPNETALLVEGAEDGFLACYEGDGNLRWARRLSSGGLVEALTVTSRPGGSFALGGLFTGTLVLGQGESEETTLACAGVIDGYLACYEAGGNLIWARQTFAADSADVGTVWALASFEDGSLAVAGDYEGLITLGLGEAAEVSLTSTPGAKDAYLARYDATGALNWAITTEGSGDESVFGLAVTPSGDIRVAGTFGGEAAFRDTYSQITLLSEGAADGFVAAFSGMGAFQWATRFGGAGYDGILGVCVQPDGRTVVAGYFQGAATLGRDVDEEISLETPEANDLDGFFATLSEDGRPQCALRLGGSGDDYLTSVAATGPGSTLLAGTLVLDACIGGPDLQDPAFNGAEGATEMSGRGARDACLVYLAKP